MLAIDNSAALNYCKAADNTLAAAMTFAISGTTLTLVDTTDYTGETAKMVNVEVFDNFGNKKDANIPEADADNTITVDLSTGFNKSEGVSILATVTTVSGKRKDGSIILTQLASGSLKFEK
jgi:hypothetical protein